MIENKGMCPPMSDEEYFSLMTENGTKDVAMVIGFYPQLAIFIKEIE